MTDLDALAGQARGVARKNFGPRITFYVPGMFHYNGTRGKYPAISLTGSSCALQCRHCQAKLLEPMIPATTPEELVAACLRLEQEGDIGCLLSGGLSPDGTIPWLDFIPAIREIKTRHNLKISIHCGLLDKKTARLLKEAGVDQALIDVIGEDRTLEYVYHAGFKVSGIIATLDALQAAGIPFIPHIVAGLDHGVFLGEYRALDIIRQYHPAALVIVSLMPLPDTPMAGAKPPDARDIARLIATARMSLTSTPLALGCARKRGDDGIDSWAVKCGANRIAIPSDRAVRQAQDEGLEIEWRKTCCSLD
jgi:uncharacterized radical SAM superfamily protein